MAGHQITSLFVTENNRTEMCVTENVMHRYLCESGAQIVSEIPNYANATQIVAEKVTKSLFMRTLDTNCNRKSRLLNTLKSMDSRLSRTKFEKDSRT